MAYRMHLMICAGTACVSSRAFEVRRALEEELKSRGLENEILLVNTGCNGFCAQGPVLVVKPEDIFYQLLTPEKNSPLSNPFESSLDTGPESVCTRNSIFFCCIIFPVLVQIQFLVTL